MVFGITATANSLSRFHPNKEGLTRRLQNLLRRPTMIFLCCALISTAVTQVSRIALRGNCLFSAGHDGQVNHYVVSYSVSSFGMLANSEPRRHSSAASPGRHASGEYAALSCSETVDLTIVTTYATAPVTTVSELWVSGDWNWEAGPKKLAAGGSKGQVRVAVAGRSGSSRMSVWDLTESRQILEVRFSFFGSVGSCLLYTALSCLQKKQQRAVLGCSK